MNITNYHNDNTPENREKAERLKKEIFEYVKKYGDVNLEDILTDITRDTVPMCLALHDLIKERKILGESPYESSKVYSRSFKYSLPVISHSRFDDSVISMELEEKVEEKLSKFRSVLKEIEIILPRVYDKIDDAVTAANRIYEKGPSHWYWKGERQQYRTGEDHVWALIKEEIKKVTDSTSPDELKESLVTLREKVDKVRLEFENDSTVKQATRTLAGHKPTSYVIPGKKPSNGTRMFSITERLDRIASEIEPINPVIALAIDKISDRLETAESIQTRLKEKY